METDEELAARVGDGDSTALEALVARYEHALAAFLSRRTGGRDVDDLYQETWLRVVRAARRFDANRRFSTWLFEIAANLSRDWWRRRGQESESTSPEGERMADPRSLRDPTDTLAVEALLAKLPDVQREVLVLRYYHDASEAEMSEILGCPRGTVKSRIHNALQRLAAVLSDAGGGTGAASPSGEPSARKAAGRDCS